VVSGVRKKRLERTGLIKRTGKWFGRILVAVVALLVLFWLGKQAYVFCAGEDVKTETAQWSELAAAYEGQAIILSNETVVAAPASGNVTWLATEGTRVHVGTAVARIGGTTGPGGARETVAVYSPAAGIVSCHPDGWEGLLTPANYQRMDLFALFGTVKPQSPPVLSQDVQSGSPLFKIVDNLTDPCFVVKFDTPPDGLKVGTEVELEWGAGGQGDGEVIGLQSRASTFIAIVDVSQATVDAFTSRTLDVKLINKQCEGIVVPTQAVVTQGGTRGVYVRTPLGIEFVGIQVVGTLGNMTALNGVQPGMDIVINPGLVKQADLQT
jgi:putative membrane fusion protein